MRIQFNTRHRHVYGEKSIEFSLLTVAGLIIAEVASEDGISLMLLIAGIILFLLGCVTSYLFLKDLWGGG